MSNRTVLELKCNNVPVEPDRPVRVYPGQRNHLSVDWDGDAGAALHVETIAPDGRTCRKTASLDDGRAGVELGPLCAPARYEYEAGVLPEMAYYPDDVRLDPESMYSILEPYGLAATNCVCPGCAAVLQDTGITYVWNTQVNGKPLRSLDPPQWLVVEMNALSAKVPAPHWGRYNVLYSDGKVRDEGRRP